MSINFETNNLVIVVYPPGAGGKFLINCLGLSSDAVFQDNVLALRQLDGNFDPTAKFNLLIDRINQTVRWNDLSLGCSELFGIPNDWYSLFPPSIMAVPEMFSESIEHLSNSDKKFFLVAHSPELVPRYLGVWPRAKIVYFQNCLDFIRSRKFQMFGDELTALWNERRGDIWPPTPPKTYTEFLRLDDALRRDISKNHEIVSRLYIVEQGLIAHEQSFAKFPGAVSWDNNVYFSSADTVSAINDLYTQLGLADFNEDSVKKYYESWMAKLSELKSKIRR